METKKDKKIGKDAKIMITWGSGFLLVVLVMVIDGKYTITVGDLAAMGILLIFFGWGISVMKRYQKKRKQQIPTEPHEPVPYGNG